MESSHVGESNLRDLSTTIFDPSPSLSNSTWPTRDRLVPLAVQKWKEAFAALCLTILERKNYVYNNMDETIVTN